MTDTALLIIDMQMGNFQGPNPVHDGVQLLGRVSSLLRKARSARVPVIYVRNVGGAGDPDEYGTAGFDIHPSINPDRSDIVIDKKTPDSFHGTYLKHELDRRGISKLVVAGLQTEYCVDTTCRRAFSLGYDVVLVGDAHSTWDTSTLSAQQIIRHHNNVLGGPFVTVKSETDIEF